jgi:hypothetical protein
MVRFLHHVIQDPGFKSRESLMLLTVSYRWMDVVNADSWCYVCRRGNIVKIRFKRGFHPTSPRFSEIWILIAGFTLWYVWKVCCLKVFQGTVRPPEEVIMDIWSALISCLRGQLEEVCSHSNDVATARLRFWQKWQNTPMVMQGGSCPRWNYQPPRWLFPTHLPSLFGVGPKSHLVLENIEGLLTLS